MEKMENTKAEPSSSSKFDFPEGNDWNTVLLKSLLCTSKNCKQFVYPPIKQCRSGHTLCITCPGRLCSVCDSPIIEGRNLALEAIAEKLLVACVYRTAGCPEVMPVGYNMPFHEFQCAFRPHKCFGAKCSWFGSSNKILAHTENCHKERVVLGSEKEFKVKKLHNRSELDMTFLFSCEYGNFWGKFIYKKSDPIFYGAVQYIGQVGVASTYKYTFEIAASVGSSVKKFTYCRKTHPDVITFEMIFQSHDCLCIPIDFVRYLADDGAGSVDGTVTVKMNIEKNT